jgi:hypothetical protein
MRNVEALRRYSTWMLILATILVPLTMGVLLIGFGMVGAGHGTYTVWFFGLGLCWVCWLALVGSACFGIVAFLQSRKLTASTVIAVTLVILATLIGLWGLQG